MPDLSLSLDTPVGRLRLVERDQRLTRIDWGGTAEKNETPLLCRARDQILRYFDGDRVAFDLPLDLGSEGFQHAFLDALLTIPYGETREYGDLARALGVSAQAIGQACGANRLPIVIPCHRVLAANGLGGYSGVGGIETKVALLRLEGAAGLLI